MTETKQIPLANGGFAVVDASDFDRLMQSEWVRNDRGYAVRVMTRNGTRSLVGMHRMLLDPPKGMMADHINGDRLDNRRCNLRIVSALQNAQNRGRNKVSTSLYKGVCWKVENNKWQARIRVNGKQHHIGLYDTEEDAARAYNSAAILNHGDYSRLNIIPGDPAPCKPDECPVCLRTTEPVSVSLEKCTAAALACKVPDGFDRNGSHSSGTYQEYEWSLRTYLRPQDEWKATELVKTVLDAAGVRYVD